MSESAPDSVEALLAHSDWVRALARGLVGDSHAADYLAQEALLAALERPPRDVRNVRGWVVGVLRNLHLQQRRRPRDTELASPRGDQELDTLELVERAESQHLVVEALLGLHEPYRSTLLLRYFEDLSPRAIAARQRVPLATVTSRLTRAHARLRERLDQRAQRDGRSWISALVPLLRVEPGLGVGIPSALATLLVSSALKITLLSSLVLALAWNLTNLSSSAGEELPPAEPPPAAARAESELKVAVSITERSSLEPEPPTVEPQEATPLPALTGRVFDPAGEPIEGASIVLGDAGKLQFVEAGTQPGEYLTVARSEADGAFAFDALPGGRVTLTAGSPGLAPSVSVEFTHAAGETHRDIELRLRKGGTIRGEVLRPDGSAAPQRYVRLLMNGVPGAPSTGRLARLVETDDQGFFEARGLCPGSWGVVTYPDDEELEEIGGGLEHMLQATVELEDLGDEFVSLGAPSDSAVSVKGMILSDTGAERGMLQWIAEGADPMGSQRLAQAGADGRYEVELPRPGAWFVRVMGQSAHQDFWIDIPEEAEHERDFELFDGSVTGRVVDAQGQPLPGVEVSRFLLRGGYPRLAFAGALDRTSSAADGTFRLTGMGPGTYSLSARHTEHGVAQAQTIDLNEGQQLTGIELIVGGEVRLEGRVLDVDGEPKGCPVWIYDERGHLLNPISNLYSSKGTFVTPPLPPGRYSFLARNGTDVAQALSISTEDPPQDGILMQLQPGASLIVEVQGEDGPVRPSPRVFDLDGRPWTGLHDRLGMWAWQRYPLDSRRRQLGPLVPGTYSVEVEVEGRMLSSRQVTVGSGEVREVSF